MKKIKSKITKEVVLLVAIFLFIFLICFLTPIVGDDWKNHVISSGNLNYIIDQTISMYRGWEGRIGSRLFIYLITSHKIIYDIIVALLTTSAIYVIGNIFKTKNKLFVYLLSFLAIILCYRAMFLETYLYVAGGITYFFPTMLMIGYLYYYFKHIAKKSCPWYSWIILAIMTIFISTSVEHIGFTFTAINFILLVYNYYQDKKINPLLLMIFIISVIGCLFMVASPGNALRNKIDGNDMSVIKTIISNNRNFIYYTFTANFFLLILMDTIYFVFIDKNFTNKIFKIISNLIVFIPTLVISILNILSRLDILNIDLMTSKPVRIYFILYAFGLIYLFIKTIKEKEYYLILITALLPNLAMLASPIWGGRTTFTTVLLLSFLCILIIDKYYFKENRKWEILGLVILTSLVGLFYLAAYTNMYRFNKMQQNTIKDNISNDYICVYDSPSYLILGLTPYDEYHVDTYKEYYKIPEATNLKYCGNKWKYYIFYQE